MRFDSDGDVFSDIILAYQIYGNCIKLYKYCEELYIKGNIYRRLSLINF